MPKVLFVLTSHDRLGDTGKPTGYYVPEAAHPWHELSQAGAEVRIASIQGGTPPQSGYDPDDAVQRAFLRDPGIERQLANTPRLADVDAEEVGAVLFVGGHGTMWDFPPTPTCGASFAKSTRAGGISSAVCHGPSALVNACLSRRPLSSRRQDRGRAHWPSRRRRRGPELHSGDCFLTPRAKKIEPIDASDHAPDRARLAAMKIATPKQRVILDAAIDNSVIRGTVAGPSRDRREFYGRLELNPALEAMLDSGADQAPNNSFAASASVPSVGRGSRSAGERSDWVSRWAEWSQ